MFSHIATLIYRNIIRFPGTFLINVLGLSTGLACSLVIYLWISDELSFNRFHEHGDRIYQVVENQQNASGIVSREETPIGMAYVLGETMPDIEYAATVTPTAWFPKFVIENNGARIKNEGRFVGKDFFQIFSFELAYGTKETVFNDINSVVISEPLAITLFGSAGNAVGKPIPWTLSDIKKESLVSGVFKTLPSNSSEQFDIVFNIDLLGQIMGFSKDDLGGPGPSTFVMLKPGVDVADFNKKMSDLMSERTPNKQSNFFLAKYSDKYLYGKYQNGVQSGGRIEYVKLFGVIGLIILVIACINFTNLSTARASRRMKEVGIKKVVGAWRSSLIAQYFAESLFISFASLAVALVFVVLILPFFNDITGKQLVFEMTVARAIAFLLVALITGVLAGCYPALYLSGFKPVQVLKGKIFSSYSEVFIRKGLVVFQFTVSIVFIVSVIVLYKQMSFIQHRNLGYDKENIIYMEIEGEVATHKNAFIEEIKKINGVVNASAMNGTVVGALGNPVEATLQDKKIPVHILNVDFGLIETVGIKMESGRSFDSNRNDADKVVINGVAAKQLGVSDPIGQKLQFWGRTFEIIGVTDNFHHSSLYEEITPLVMRMETQQLMSLFIRLEANNQDETIQRLKNFYATFNPGYAFDYRFLDYQYQAQYRGEKQVADLCLWFSALTVIIACLGLFGLAAFSAGKRIKEIGIRKVLGATPASIVYLLSSEFIKLVLIAILIGLPLSFYLINEWLVRFAYSVELEAWFFVVSGLVAVLIALATVGGQAVKASVANPAMSLKEE